MDYWGFIVIIVFNSDYYKCLKNDSWCLTMINGDSECYFHEQLQLQLSQGLQETKL